MPLTATAADKILNHRNRRQRVLDHSSSLTDLCRGRPLGWRWMLTGRPPCTMLPFHWRNPGVVTLAAHFRVMHQIPQTEPPTACHLVFTCGHSPGPPHVECCTVFSGLHLFSAAGHSKLHGRLESRAATDRGSYVTLRLELAGLTHYNARYGSSLGERLGTERRPRTRGVTMHGVCEVSFLENRVVPCPASPTARIPCLCPRPS